MAVVCGGEKKNDGCYHFFLSVQRHEFVPFLSFLFCFCLYSSSSLFCMPSSSLVFSFLPFPFLSFLYFPLFFSFFHFSFLFPFFPLLFLFLSSLFPLKMVSSIFSNCPLFHPPYLHSLS